MTRRLHIETVGCQMNVLDSELVVGALRRQGWELAETREEADAVLFNTCSIREHAEEKVYSQLGTLKAWKRRRPHGVVGVLGCMAQKDKERIFERAPHVDLVAGPGELEGVPELIEEVVRTRQPRLAVSLDRKDLGRRQAESSFASWDPNRDPEMRPTPFQAFVRTQLGCDKFCSYCIVPSVRGPEQGRDPSEIAREVAVLAAQGVKEITLLGQTVNSYRVRGADGRLTRLSDLLEKIHDTAGIERIRFVTNFPNDMTDDLLQAVRDLPKVCPYLHVPAQSGSDAVLARMKRHYTVAQYREMVARTRETVPGASFTSDFIVGFCGETEDDFEATVSLVKDCGFKNSFIFAYSPRPGTGAFPLGDDVPEETKKRRTIDLLQVQQEVSRADHRRLIGSVVEVLVEGPSRLDRSGVQLTGRTKTDHIVVFDGPVSLAGSIVKLSIEDASALTLFGKLEGATRVAAPPARRPSLPVIR